MLTCAVEVIIQDTEADLNVYTTAMTEDGVRNEASGETSNPETSAGCASTAPGGTGCCAPKASKAEDGSSPATLQGAGCCFREAEDNPGVTTVVAGLGETDLNDWVGTYCRSYPSIFAPTNAPPSRLVSHLCREALRVTVPQIPTTYFMETKYMIHSVGV